MRVFADFSPEVEALSLDEAFLDMTGAERLFGDPEAMGRRLNAAIREATGGLTASVGLSGTKYVAKVASGYRKPDGLTVVPPEAARALLAPMPVSRLWGAGLKTEPRLLEFGLRTIGDVAAADPKLLADKLGKIGLHLYTLANAQDPRRAGGRIAAKSIGSENTLERDVRGKSEIKLHLRRSADKIVRRLRSKGLVASGVGVKLKSADFKIFTRQQRLREPTDVAEQLYTVGVELLDAFKHQGLFRLVGMVAYDLSKSEDATQTGLFDPFGRRRRSEVALDALAQRFGGQAVQRGDDLTLPTGTTLTPNLDFLDDGLLDGDR